MFPAALESRAELYSSGPGRPANGERAGGLDRGLQCRLTNRNRRGSREQVGRKLTASDEKELRQNPTQLRKNVVFNCHLHIYHAVNRVDVPPNLDSNKGLLKP